MFSPEKRLQEIGIVLSEAPAPLGSYVPCVQSGNLLFLSGMLPLREGKLIRTGRVGESVSLFEAQEGARQAVCNALSILKAYLGNLDRIARCIRLNGYIASAPDFTEQPKVLNAASELLVEIFGEAGRHTRTAIGVHILPLNSPLEIDFIFEIQNKS
jgi:enamine deaminase RidA (YjgF/YER057c/UK114 family)